MQFGTCTPNNNPNPNVMIYVGSFPVSFTNTPYMFATVISHNNSRKEIAINAKIVTGKSDYSIIIQSTIDDLNNNDAYAVSWLAIGV